MVKASTAVKNENDVFSIKEALNDPKISCSGPKLKIGWKISCKYFTYDNDNGEYII